MIKYKEETMKKIYIKPCVELLTVHTESLLGTGLVSNQGNEIKVNSEEEKEFDFNIDNSGDNSGYDFAKPDVPNIWDDEEW